MVSDKETMMGNANYYSGLVASAKNTCADLILELTTQINEINYCWKGEAGLRMVQSIEAEREKIKNLAYRLQDLEQKMKSQATNIYNSWPEEETDV